MAPQSLQEQLRQRDVILDCASDGIFVRDLDGVIVYWNRSAERIYGWSSAEALGRVSHDILSTQFPQSLPQIEGIVFREGHWEGQLVQRAKDGSPLTVSSRWAVQRGDLGQPSAIVEINSDVSTGHRSELLRGFLEAAPDAMIIAGQDGRIVLVNAQTEKLLGYSRQELLGQSVEMLMPTRFRKIDPRQRETPAANSHSGKAPGGPELLARRKDGSEVPVEISLSSVKADGEVLTFRSIRDVSDRRLAQQALTQTNQELEGRVADRTSELRHNESRLRALVESLDEIVLELDLQGVCLAIWTLNETLLPLPKREMIGVKISDHLDQASRDIFEASLKLVAAGETAADFEYTQQVPAGRRSFLSRITPIRLPGAGSRTLCMLVRDITARKVQEQKTAQGQKMEAIGRLAGGIAHDFNNMLAVILGYAEIIQEAVERGTPIDKQPAEIIKAAESAASLTRQLLAFSRQQVLELRPLDLNHVIWEIEGLVKRLVGASIQVNIHTGERSRMAKADPNQMEQVILNLAANARDAMPDGGELRIETSHVELTEPYLEHQDVPPGSYVVLTISDSGVGMDPETQARVFEPFFTTKSLGKGTGLGLATVYGIIQQSGGYIWLYSELGHGTTFKILLPQLEQQAAEVAVPRETSLVATGGETILLVEDVEPLRLLINDTLTSHGYSVIEAPNGVAALRLIAKRTEPVHLLITDVAMPEMGGRKLSILVREIYPQIRVLYITGYATQAFQGSDVRLSASLLEKPFTRSALVLKVQETLRRN